MDETAMTSLAAIAVLGIGAQWIAWRFNWPSILLLLLFGIAAGPSALKILDPDHLFGELLLPFVSMSVSIILFEGGLTLKFSEIRTVRHVVRNMITLGTLVTWGLTTLAAYLVLDTTFEISLLLGAILVVSGPTVVIPLLRQIRPKGRVRSILQWEGILIDPIGAVLALLVFEEVITAESLGESTSGVILVIVRTLVIGLVFGWVGARILMELFRRYWVPDHLQNPITLMILLGGFALSNTLQSESGLLTATVMGIVLANQNQVTMRHVLEFKETLGLLLLSALFIILAARLRTDTLDFFSTRTLLFLGILVVFIRPAAVFVSTINSHLTIAEKIFLSAMAPRGIVAAAVASIFALELEEAGLIGGDLLIPYTFDIIIGSVIIYGLAAGPIARVLKLAEPDPQGVLILGAHTWARIIAKAIQDAGFKVNLVDTNHHNVALALYEGLPAVSANVLAENFAGQVDLGNIGRLLALTSNNEVNALAALNLAEAFGRSDVYRLCIPQDEIGQEASFGRTLFRGDAHFDYFEDQFYNGAEIVSQEVGGGESWRDEQFEPMFVVDGDNLTIWAADAPPTPRAGQKVIGMKPVVVDTR